MALGRQTEPPAQPIAVKFAKPRARAVAVFALAFGSGFVIMSLELLGGRILAPWFGGSIHVWGSVITVFLLSLAAGYYLGGWLSLRSPSIARLGGLLVVAAAVLYPITLLADPLMSWVFTRVEDARYGSLLASLALFVAPTILLGVISPYSVRLLVRRQEESGKVAGTLYFVSTLGSALGTLATSFYFVLWFEINTIVGALSGALLALGVLAMIGALLRRA